MPANMVCDMNFSLKDQVNKWVWCYVDYKLLLLRENVEKVMNGKKKSLDGSNKFTVFEFHTSKSKSLNNSAIHVQIKLKCRVEKIKLLKNLIETEQSLPQKQNAT